MSPVPPQWRSVGQVEEEGNDVRSKLHSAEEGSRAQAPTTGTWGHRGIGAFP